MSDRHTRANSIYVQQYLARLRAQSPDEAAPAKRSARRRFSRVPAELARAGRAEATARSVLSPRRGTPAV